MPGGPIAGVTLGAAPTAGVRPLRNGSALAAVLAGLLSVATMPVAIAVTRSLEEYDLIHAGFAIPVGMAFGVAAVALARRARLRIERTLGRARGRRTAGIGRFLGVLGFCLATTAAISVGTYAVLTLVAE